MKLWSGFHFDILKILLWNFVIVFALLVCFYFVGLPELLYFSLYFFVVSFVFLAFVSHFKVNFYFVGN